MAGGSNQILTNTRGQLRVFAAALNVAATMTAAYLLPEVPEQLWIAWGGVVMAGVGILEVFIDRR